MDASERGAGGPVSFQQIFRKSLASNTPNPLLSLPRFPRFVSTSTKGEHSPRMPDSNPAAPNILITWFETSDLHTVQTSRHCSDCSTIFVLIIHFFTHLKWGVPLRIIDGGCLTIFSAGQHQTHTKTKKIRMRPQR